MILFASLTSPLLLTFTIEHLEAERMRLSTKRVESDVYFGKDQLLLLSIDSCLRRTAFYDSPKASLILFDFAFSNAKQ
jgi:hypothetical protein